MASVLATVAPGAGAQLAPGDVLVADFEAGANGNGLLFLIDPMTGGRRVLSDFGNPAQGPTSPGPFNVAVEDAQSVYVLDNQGGAGGSGTLVRVNPANGWRTLLSDFGDATQGPTGIDPVGIAFFPGRMLVTDRDAGTGERGVLFRVDRTSGRRALLSDFGNPAQGPLGKTPTGIARGARGSILVVDPDAGADGKGILFLVDGATGWRRIVSDFGDPAQGPTGVNPGGVAHGANGVVLVGDTEAGTGGLGALFAIDPRTGQRTVISEFGEERNGPTGADPFWVALSAKGSVLVSDFSGGIDIPLDGHVGGNGALFVVNPQNGARTLLSDFGDPAQGQTGAQPSGVAIVPLAVEGDAIVVSPFTGSGGAGELVSVDPVTGARAVLSDFGVQAQGQTGVDPVDVALGPGGDLLVVDEDWRGLGALFSIHPLNGARTVLSDFNNAAQGPRTGQPSGVVLESESIILVVSVKGGTNNRGALTRIDPVTGNRTLLSDFGDLAQGPVGSSPDAVEMGTDGSILVIDSDAGIQSGANGLLFRVDPVTGSRSVESDFRDANGPVGIDPRDLIAGPPGQLLVTDVSASPALGGYGVLFAVDAATGKRRIVSDFGDASLGITGSNPSGVCLMTDGSILVADNSGGTGGAGALFRVNPATGIRVRVSDFGNPEQGPTGALPSGLALLDRTGAPGDFFSITDILVAPAGVTLSWTDPAKRSYTVEQNASLAADSWSPVPGVNWPVNAHSILLPPPDAPGAFFRVRAE